MKVPDTFVGALRAFRRPLAGNPKLVVVAVAAVGLLVGFSGAVLVAVRSNRSPAAETPLIQGPHVTVADFTVPDANGRPVRVKDFAGRVVVLALSDDNAPSAALHYLAKHPLPNLRFAFGGGRLRRLLSYRGLPTTLLVDTGGRVIATFSGWGWPGEIPTLRSLIAKL